ncbi:hypothetical protein T492DRAFT_935703 [Pavlovales sp. CCMP2436]|nr:hypothetical protein T492DRAFT_935703 [Pavlovales sp. CCMP2436]
MALKDAWDASSDEESAAAPAIAPAAAPAVATAAAPAEVDESLPEDATVPDAHPATAQARLFWGAGCSLRCCARALALGANADEPLTARVMEELETIVCSTAGASSLQAELGDSAMHVAVRAGRLECVLFLLGQLQADQRWPCRRNRQGERVIDVAASGSVLIVVIEAGTRALLAHELQRGMASGADAVAALPVVANN